MKKYLQYFLLVLFVCICAGLSAQEQFDKTRTEVKKDLEKLAAVSPGTTKVKESDSTFVLSHAGTGGPVQFIYRFDKQTGACNYQKIQASCDSCIKKYLDQLLSQKTYGWKKINENQYVSNFESRLLIELPVDEKENSFILFRAQWTKEFYDILAQN